MQLHSALGDRSAALHSSERYPSVLERELSAEPSSETMLQGRMQVATIEGEPGIGKTRLAREFLRWARAQGADVLEARAFETGSRLPYQPLVEALRSRLEGKQD